MVEAWSHLRAVAATLAVWELSLASRRKVGWCYALAAEREAKASPTHTERAYDVVVHLGKWRCKCCAMAAVVGEAVAWTGPCLQLDTAVEAAACAPRVLGHGLVVVSEEWGW